MSCNYGSVMVFVIKIVIWQNFGKYRNNTASGDYVLRSKRIIKKAVKLKYVLGV